MKPEILKWIHITVMQLVREKRLSGLDVSVLLSAGMFGYTQCLGRFDPHRGVKFKTYARYRIRGAVLDEVRKMLGSERAKNKRPRQVDLDMSVFENNHFVDNELQLQIRNFLTSSELNNRERRILTCRMQGMNLEEIAKEFSCSRSWASGMLKIIKGKVYQTFGDELGFKIEKRRCEKCGEENIVSDRAVAFYCDACDNEVGEKDADRYRKNAPAS